MKRYLKCCLAAGILFLTGPLLAQQNVPPRAPAFATAPEIAYDSVPNFLKLPQNLYLGEGIGVARNSNGHVFVFTRRACGDRADGWRCRVLRRRRR